MTTITMYVIYRAGEYYTGRGFWPLNIYAPAHFKTEEEAQAVLNKMHELESEHAVIEPVVIKI